MKSREIAFEALKNIYENGAYSNLEVNRILKNKDPREKKLATELIYGVLEKKYALKHIINKFSTKPYEELEIEVKIVLELGIYQILYLRGVKNFAAVSESVNLVKIYNKNATGFVNAVLRNVLRSDFKKLFSDIKNPKTKLATEYSYEEWIIEELIQSKGEEFTQDLLFELDLRPEIYIRVNLNITTKQKLKEILKNQDIECFDVPGFEEALRVRGLKDIENMESFKLGLFSIQDISSMLVARVMDPCEGELVLDACSAPGGKAMHMAEFAFDEAQIVARDVHEHKIMLLESYKKRLGLENVKIELADASVKRDEDIKRFDKVLVDAPCSGFGIIKRKPEIKYKAKEDIEGLKDIQMKILKNNAKYVKDGGLLVYSTCTIREEENLGLIFEFLRENKEFKLEPITEINIDPQDQQRGYLKIYPHIHGMDGFFIAKLRKVGNNE